MRAASFSARCFFTSSSCLAACSFSSAHLRRCSSRSSATFASNSLSISCRFVSCPAAKVSDELRGTTRGTHLRVGLQLGLRLLQGAQQRPEHPLVTRLDLRDGVINEWQRRASAPTFSSVWPASAGGRSPGTATGLVVTTLLLRRPGCVRSAAGERPVARATFGSSLLSATALRFEFWSSSGLARTGQDQTEQHRTEAHVLFSAISVLLGPGEDRD